VGTTENHGFLPDLNLDQILKGITIRENRHGIRAFFLQPLTDLDARNYRQEVFRDLENNTVFQQIKIFTDNMLEMRRYLALSENSYYKYHRQRWFLEAVSKYCAAVKKLAEGLRSENLNSRGLSAFREYVTAYSSSARFTSLCKETEKLKASLNSIKYCILIDGRNVKVRKYSSEVDYSRVVTKTFEKFKGYSAKDHRAKSTSSSLCSGLFTQFRREEDPSMESGKLDEELARMSETVEHRGNRMEPAPTESLRGLLGKPAMAKIYTIRFSAWVRPGPRHLARQVNTPPYKYTQVWVYPIATLS